MKIKSILPIITSLSILAIIGHGQTPEKRDEDAPIRISTELVQIDLLALDKDGNPVDDLTPDDIQVFQDGKEQSILSMTYISPTETRRVTGPKSKAAKKNETIGIPPSRPRNPRGRIITFIIDDANCLATLDGTVDMRDAVLRFINQRMLPDDRVAIYRTATGANLLQIYTSNKEALKRAVKKTNLLPSRNCGSMFEAFRDDSTIKANAKGASSFETEEGKELRVERQDRERRNQIVGTVGVIDFVVDRLKDIPQRKMIFLFSEGLAAQTGNDSFDVLRDVADRAARASVVIHALSSKGLTIPGFLSAQDEVLPGIIGGLDNTIASSQSREDEERLLNTGLAYLAYTTGGSFVRNSNRLEANVEEIIERYSGYYLVAYEPIVKFDGKSFHNIQLRSKRPGIALEYRKGFFGRETRRVSPSANTKDSPLFQAIASPLQENGLDVRLTVISEPAGQRGSKVRTLLYVPGGQIDLARQSDGSARTEFDVVGVILNEKGKVVDEFNRTYPMSIPPEGVAVVEANGLDFSADLAIDKPGVYSVRVAIRDSNSGRLGSAGEVLIVRRPKLGDLNLTGFITTFPTKNDTPFSPAARPPNAAFAPVLMPGTPSVRRYRPGSVLLYVYQATGAGAAKGSRERDLTREIRLYKEGSLIAAFDEKPVDIDKIEGDVVHASGGFRLSDAMEPGEYTLQLILRDRVLKKTATEWIDFEVSDQ